MITTRRRASGVVLGFVLLTTACSEGGSLTISNESQDSVTVRLGDEEVVVPSMGGALLHDYGCSPGDVAVISASAAGDSTMLQGPVCSDQQILVDRAGHVTVAPEATDG